MSDIILGAHVSLSSPDFFLGSVKEALSYGANTLMFYTGAPQNTLRRPTHELFIKEGQQLLKESGIDLNQIVVHAPYIINLANASNAATFDLAVSFLKEELRRVSDFGVKILILHPGSHVGNGEEIGLNQIIKGLNLVLDEDDSDVIIALETMAGKGSELGRTFEEIAVIIHSVSKSNRLGVCLDTCHINDAGYEVGQVDDVLNQFDKIIGIDRLKVVHINDSKNIRGAQKDRHENIGYGTIGFKTIHQYVTHPRLLSIPKILETPYLDKKAPYKTEISMLRNGVYQENWRDQL